MGMFDRYGAGAAAGMNNIAKIYEAAQQRKLEQQRLDQNKIGIEAAADERRAIAEERQARMAAIQAEAQRKQNLQKALQGLMGPQQVMDPGGVGPMQPGRPTQEQIMSTWMQNDPDTALPQMLQQAMAQEKMLGQGALQDERLAMQDKLNQDRSASQAAMLEARSNAQMETLKTKLESDKALLETKNDAASKAMAAKIDSALELMKMKMEQTGKGVNKAPTGYRFTENDELEPIVGGPADFKMQKEFSADTGRVDMLTGQLNDLERSATELKGHKGLPRIYGVMGVVPNIPGGNAADAEAKLNELKSKIGFSVLQTMRDMSKTGGALGQVSDFENKQMQMAIQNLDKAQSVDQVKGALDKIIEFTNRSKNSIKKAFDTKYEKKESIGKSKADPLGIRK